ncbi:MAG: S1 family peptidase [Chloroflexota bacterium]
MRSRAALATAVASLTLMLSTQTSLAITKNYVADFDHPYVAMVAFYDATGSFSHRCTGSLIDASTMITAGHCVTDDNGGVMPSARVWFQQGAGTHYDPATQHDPVTGYPDDCAAGTAGTLCTTSHRMFNYGYGGNFASDSHDMGLMILDAPIEMPVYAKLPAAGALDSLIDKKGTQDRMLRVSGYGLSYKGPQKVTSYRERLMGDEQLINTTSAVTGGVNLQANGNGKDKAGTCNGDSGGPVFYPATSNTMVALTSFGLNEWCRGTDFAYRLDRAAPLAWIAEHRAH